VEIVMSGERCRGLRIGLLLSALALTVPACGSTPKGPEPQRGGGGATQARTGHENAGRDRALEQLDRNLAGDVPIEDARPLNAPHVPPSIQASPSTAAPGEALSAEDWPVDTVEDEGDTLIFWSTGEGATLADALANGDSRARQEAMNTRSSKVTTVSSDNISSTTGGSFESTTQIASQGALHGVSKAASAGWVQLDDGSYWVRARLEVPSDQIYPQRELDRIFATRSGQQLLDDVSAYKTRAETRGDTTFAALAATRLVERQPSLPTLNAAVEAQLQAGNYFRADSLVDLHGAGFDDASIAAMRARIQQAIPDARATLDRLLRQARTASSLNVAASQARVTARDHLSVTGNIPADHGYALAWLDDTNLQLWVLFGPEDANGGRTSRTAAGSQRLEVADSVFEADFVEGDALVPGDVHLLVLAAPGNVNFDFVDVDLEKCARKDPTELSHFHKLVARLEDFISTPAAGHRIGVATWTQYE
jgi:hypothetical protein